MIRGCSTGREAPDMPGNQHGAGTWKQLVLDAIDAAGGAGSLQEILQSYLALRTRSFWYGVVIHGATAVTLDILVVLMKHHRH